MKSFVIETHRALNWANIPALADWVVAEAIRIQQIPAPTFAESARAAYVAQQMETFGLRDVEVDSLSNVYGRLPGHTRGTPGLMLSAHTDTVFDAATDLTVRRENGTIYGPGLGDNSLGVSALLGLAKYMAEHQIQPACDMWFVATVCEEGLGDLKGMRAAFQRLRNQIGQIINLEGLSFGHVYNGGIAVQRLHITATTEGGHSWLHFGKPSAIHGIVELGAQICRIVPPAQPRTTYNIGMLEGGQTINAIASKAGLWLDLRSESHGELQRLRQRVETIIRQLTTPEMRFQIEVVGDRPAGAIPVQHPLIQGALAALELEEIKGTLEAGSTDGNIPLAYNYPTVTIGITRGGNAHRLDEFIETVPVVAGMRHFITLALAAARHGA
jgi:acetylornithine deacetylase/succinyl-diaminopimelate desuccinylase-like protein